MQILPTQPQTLSPALQTCMQAVIHLAGQQHQHSEHHLQNFFQNLSTLFKTVPIAEHSQLVAAIAQSLEKINAPLGIGYLSLWLGSQVEDGQSPDIAAPYLVNLLTQLLLDIEFEEEEDPEEKDQEGNPVKHLYVSPPPAELEDGLMFMGQGLVAHIARSPELKAQLQDNEVFMNVLERTEAASIGITWLLQLLWLNSTELLVIHAEKRVGVKVRYENIRLCAHLFTLLQGTLAGIMPGAVANPKMFANALGQNQEQGVDQACWHYGQGNSPTADVMASLWVDLPVRYISEVDGIPVILLWDSLFKARTWDNGFFHPMIEATPPSLKVLGQLTPEEVTDWLNKIGVKSE